MQICFSMVSLTRTPYLSLTLLLGFFTTYFCLLESMNRIIFNRQAVFFHICVRHCVGFFFFNYLSFFACFSLLFCRLAWISPYWLSPLTFGNCQKLCFFKILGCKQEGSLAIANSSVWGIIGNLNQLINYSKETLRSTIILFCELWAIDDSQFL